MSKVFVGMSGGVDSSVAAVLLKEQGHDVTGITLHLTVGCEENGCCGWEAIHDAKQVCAQLGIPHYTINRRDLFHEQVTGPFMEGYLAGVTPNPCVVCNDVIKFGTMLDFALKNGADYLAMGHYARVLDGRLCCAINSAKDQSYFLYRMLDRVDKVLFPLGEFSDKDEIRKLAEHFDIHVARKKDSQEVCFVNGSYIDLFDQESPLLQTGDAVDLQGNLLGHHRGVLRYTLGQRRGICMHRQQDIPLFVVEKDLETNTLVLGTLEDLVRDDTVLEDVIATPDLESLPLNRIEAVTRYHGARIPIIEMRRQPNGQLYVRFDGLPEHHPAPGQSVVFYDGDRVVGGGFVTQQEESP